MKNNLNPLRFLFFVAVIMLCIYLLATLRVKASEGNPFDQPVKVRCTCYIDHGTTASGKQTREGIMAGKREWIGCTACVNAVNEDGSIGEFIGYYEILDTGYGRETGEGVSKLFKNRTIGTIEAGKTVDIWQPTRHQAEEWVDQYGDYIYIKIVDGKG